MKLGSSDIGSVYLGANEVQKVYLGTNLVWENGGFDADYQAILDYATTQGYTLPSASQQILQNQLMLDLKAAGAWSKLDSFAIFATDGNSDFALICWKRLVQMTAVNSPTFGTDGGFQGNGTSSYIDTGLNSLTSGLNFTQNDASFMSWVDNIISGSNVIGAASGTRNKMGTTNFAFSQNITSVNSLNSAADMTGTGFKAIHRTSSTNVELFNNSTQYSRTQTSSTGGGVFLILREANSYMNARTRFFAAGASLVSETPDIYDALNTYYTSL